ncbi:hypothetical protein BLD48_11890 [Exiguobacterium sp. KRL4]|uniref:hypothetical protein n=1 Tax=Exiguobacterium sp. KRL4 TaxID=1914536 RepID=UPI0008F8306F|nr:hypothetical protein [Exiguobacterium sp. KRL4]OIN66251.1 hypothetical protein BLD48_11890 [Exiguobacterium sp. KRL4]
MKQYTVDNWITLQYPQTFEYQEEETFVSFYSTEENAMGTLQLSIYESDTEELTPFEAAEQEINLLVEEFGIELTGPLEARRNSSKEALLAVDGKEEEVFIRIFAYSDGERLVLLTYSADRESLELEEIETMILSLSWIH